VFKGRAGDKKNGPHKRGKKGHERFYDNSLNLSCANKKRRRKNTRLWRRASGEKPKRPLGNKIAVTGEKPKELPYSTHGKERLLGSPE